MYYPSLFAPVRPFDPPVVPVGNNPLDLSVKTLPRQGGDSTAEAEELLMLDHRKLAASHSLAAMGRQMGLVDPGMLFRYDLMPQFCYDRTTGVAVPGHQLMTTLLQQQQQQRELLAARSYMDPLRTQRTGLYAPALPTPMVLPAFSLYTEDKGAFTSLRDKNFADATRFAEHLQRLSGKCCSALHAVPCACCVPSQAALSARSPMGPGAKEPVSATTGKGCNDYAFLQRAPDIRLSVSSLVTTQTTTEPVTVSSTKPVIWNAGLPTTTTTSATKTAFSVPSKSTSKSVKTEKEDRSYYASHSAKPPYLYPQAVTTVTSATPVVPTKCEGGTVKPLPETPKPSVIAQAPAAKTKSPKKPVVKEEPAPLPKPIPQFPTYHGGWIPPPHPNVTVTSTATATVKPDNVLQSLLVPTASSTAPPPAASVITPPANAPLFGLDYRYYLNQFAAANQPMAEAEVKHKSTKKRPAPEEPAKKRLAPDYGMPFPRYSFQPTAYASEAAEATECPYTFIPEPPVNFNNQIKHEKPPELAKKEVLEQQPRVAPVVAPADASKSTIIVKPSKKPSQKSASRTSINAIYDQLRKKAERLERMKTRKQRSQQITEFFQRKRQITSENLARTIEKQITMQHARKILSRLTLRWSHRRYMYKWYSTKARSVGRILKIKRKKKNGKIVYKIRGEKALKGLKEAPSLNASVSKAIEQPCSSAMPSEMKRLMANKALGETILHRAARLGYPEVVAYCLETACGNVNARDNAGYTPLHECCSRGHLDIARALLQYGADVNASAAGGIRPLHDAVENDHVEIVRLLLSYGADPSIATYSGLEPLKLARSPMMAEFLQGFLADNSGEVDSKPHLPWRFWGSAKCLDPEESGYDVLEGVPSDSEGEGDNDFLFEVSDSPHLPTYRLLLANNKAQCNYLRLSDVLRKLCMSKEEFLEAYSHIDVLTLPKHEFEASATCSQLLASTPHLDVGNTTDLVRLDNGIRQVLGIETISVR